MYETAIPIVPSSLLAYLSLVPGSRYNAVLAPINLVRILDVRQLVVAFRMRGHTAGERVELLVDGFTRWWQRRQILVVVVLVGLLIECELYDE